MSRRLIVGLTLSAVLVVLAFSPAAGAAGTCKSPAQWRGLNRSNYVQTCQVCRSFGWRTVRREYKIHETGDVIVALRYAQKSYRPAFQQAVFAGCLRGFALRGRP